MSRPSSALGMHSACSWEARWSGGGREAQAAAAGSGGGRCQQRRWGCSGVCWPRTGAPASRHCPSYFRRAFGCLSDRRRTCTGVGLSKPRLLSARSSLGSRPVLSNDMICPTPRSSSPRQAIYDREFGACMCRGAPSTTNQPRELAIGEGCVSLRTCIARHCAGPPQQSKGTRSGLGSLIVQLRACSPQAHCLCSRFWAPLCGW
jgi:hypothetical protein